MTFGFPVESVTLLDQWVIRLGLNCVLDGLPLRQLGSSAGGSGRLAGFMSIRHAYWLGV
jgi:hypothetical protein